MTYQSTVAAVKYSAACSDCKDKVKFPDCLVSTVAQVSYHGRSGYGAVPKLPLYKKLLWKQITM